MPTYSEKVYEYEQLRLDIHANNEAFTKIISDLFKVLRNWEDDGVKNGVRFNIVGWAESHLRLLRHEELPTSSNVQNLTIELG